jgi:hypothetical protein
MIENTRGVAFKSVGNVQEEWRKYSRGVEEIFKRSVVNIQEGVI